MNTQSAMDAFEGELTVGDLINQLMQLPSDSPVLVAIEWEPDPGVAMIPIQSIGAFNCPCHGRHVAIGINGGVVLESLAQTGHVTPEDDLSGGN